jgi:hypothetical protein
MERSKCADNGANSRQHYEPDFYDALDAYIALYVCPLHNLPYHGQDTCERCRYEKRRAAR